MTGTGSCPAAGSKSGSPPQRRWYANSPRKPASGFGQHGFAARSSYRCANSSPTPNRTCHPTIELRTCTSTASPRCSWRSPRTRTAHLDLELKQPALGHPRASNAAHGIPGVANLRARSLYSSEHQLNPSAGDLRRSSTVVNGSVNDSRRVGSERVRRIDTAALVFPDPGWYWGDVAVRGDSVHVAHIPKVAGVQCAGSRGQWT